MLALQRTAGNHAVTRLMGRGVVQRHPGPTANAEVQAGDETTAPLVEEAAKPTATEATSQPGTGTTGVTGSSPPGLTGALRRTSIDNTLAASATGMWAQAIISKWKISIDYEYGGQGSFHRGGKIFLNKTLGVGAAAITLMHEAQHADTFKAGKQADRTKLGRADYVKQSIADEAEAVVRQLEGFAVTASLGGDMAGAGVSDTLKQRYLKAFYAKRDELKTADPDMDTAKVNAICRTTTRDGEVTNWFYDGTFVTSTDLNSYAVFYGKQWDEVNKAPGT